MRLSNRKKILLVLATALPFLGLAQKKRPHLFSRASSTPTDLSLRSWKKLIIETGKALGSKNIGGMSAGIAYFGVLAFFPLVASIVALTSIFFSSEGIAQVSAEMRNFLPQDIHSLIATQLENASGKTASNIVIAILAIALSIFSVSGATTHLINSLNVMYGIKEGRNFIRQRLVGIAFTIGLIIAMVGVIPLLLLGDDILRWLGSPQLVVSLFAVLRWLLMALLTMGALAILYHFGPSRSPKAEWQWVSWGAIMATIIWIAGSALFFIYLQYFANFSNSYSLFAGLIALMVWLYLSSFIVLLGAEVNHRLEQRSARQASRKLF